MMMTPTGTTVTSGCIEPGDPCGPGRRARHPAARVSALAGLRPCRDPLRVPPLTDCARTSFWLGRSFPVIVMAGG